MDLLSFYRRAWAHEDWANREVLAALRALPVPPAPTIRLMSHVAAARLLWLVRITGTGERVVVWPELTLAECEAAHRDVGRRSDEWLARLDDQELDRTVPYVNSKGEPWESVVEDILTHLLIHSTHHRGQAVLLLRQAGHAPPVTDYIHAVRQGSLKA